MSDAPWMGGTAIEGHFIIDLEMSGHPQALPNRPECCIDGVAATAEQGLCSTPAGGQVHDIHAVEAHWFCLPFEVTRSHEIGLVLSVRFDRPDPHQVRLTLEPEMWPVV